MNNSGFEIFKSKDGKTQVQVVLEDETVWLGLNQMINTDLTTKCRILSLRSEYSFVVVSALTIVNFKIACGISKYNWYNLFNRDKSIVSRHLSNVFKEKELERNSVIAKFATVQTEGERDIKKQIA